MKRKCLWCKQPVEPGDEGDIVGGEVLCRECATKEIKPSK